MLRKSRKLLCFITTQKENQTTPTIREGVACPVPSQVGNDVYVWSYKLKEFFFELNIASYNSLGCFHAGEFLPTRGFRREISQFLVLFYWSSFQKKINIGFFLEKTEPINTNRSNNDDNLINRIECGWGKVKQQRKWGEPARTNSSNSTNSNCSNCLSTEFASIN